MNGENLAIAWEYKAVPVDLRKMFGGPKIDPPQIESVLNAYGSQGWELVNGTDVNIGDGQTGYLMLLFKRPRRA